MSQEAIRLHGPVARCMDRGYTWNVLRIHAALAIFFLSCTDAPASRALSDAAPAVDASEEDEFEAGQEQDAQSPIEDAAAVDATRLGPRVNPELAKTLALAAQSPDCVADKLPDAEGYVEFLEFCVPDRLEALQEVENLLVPIAEMYSTSDGSRGLIGCDADTQTLFYELPLDLPVSVLCSLTQLEYVERIGKGFVP